MCQYNFILISKSTSEDLLKAILKESGLGYEEIRNEHICNRIDGLGKLVMTTKGHCDCGSILGIDQFPPSNKIDPEKERKKLRKRKWSEAKIERYLEDKLKTQTRNEVNREFGNKAEEERWVKLIQELTNARIKFGLFHHHFDGLIEEERLNLETEIEIRHSELSVGCLRNLEDSELLRVV